MNVSYTFPEQYPRFEAQKSAVFKTAPAATGSAGGFELNLFGGDGLSFKDILDTVNPLQQLPIVGNIYRAITGDTISTASKLAGGALFGGPVGLLSAAINTGVEVISGNDIAGNLFAMFDGPASEGKSTLTATQVAQAAASYQKATKLS